MNDLYDIIEKVIGKRPEPEDSFIDDLGADSLEMLDLLMLVEERFKIKVSTEEAAAIVSVHDLEALISEKEPAT